jgi:hypothetical protein
VGEFFSGLAMGGLLTTLLWELGIAPADVSKSFIQGCLAADPSRVVLEINGKQRCLTQEQAKAVK